MSKPVASIYIVDFFNIFSDFREIKYKQDNIDFHNIKHTNKLKDTEDFFKLFFSRYIQHANIPQNSRFIFVMKKLHGYDLILDNVIRQYAPFDIKLMIIEEKYQDDILDKNKDDFLCQYIFCVLQQNNNVVLVSNDKYRDRKTYIHRFDFDISMQTIQWNRIKRDLEKATIKFKVNQSLCSNLLNLKYSRCTIPKDRLDVIL
uniref:NYN domain-containing protein n=1 Tax=viral metagenome TaxID=1070528 RepID=A0A6C0H7Q4_9ZZZZ